MTKVSTKDKIILGVDPGTNIMGYGIVQINGRQLKLISMGVVTLKKYETYQLKLKKIFESTLSLVKQYKPDEFAIEAPFHGKNVQSMLKLGRAQGVSMAAALSMEVPVTEYSPKKIKQSITGNGNASKEQVAGMLKSILKYEMDPTFLDATDGLAVAVCHYFQEGKPEEQKNYSGWDAFLKDNPKKKFR